MFDLIPFRRGSHRGSIIPEDFFDGFFGTDFLAPMNQFGRGMKVDIQETDSQYVIEADLPGFNKEDINIDLSDNRVTISAQHNEDTEEKGDNYIRRERKSGAVMRSFLVDNVKHDQASAKYENGVLKLVLPKADTDNPRKRRIDIE
ncbi:MAG: heat shock protein Hsp20 [Firmicutes bacterium]|nr:heat shock protein Hsp20 [Bacillota bacterium]MDI6705618.1 Hsp20/alpha crystallin family protein [Bacillota bacterium]